MSNKASDCEREERTKESGERISFSRRQKRQQVDVSIGILTIGGSRIEVRKAVHYDSKQCPGEEDTISE